MMIASSRFDRQLCKSTSGLLHSTQKHACSSHTVQPDPCSIFAQQLTDLTIQFLKQ